MSNQFYSYLVNKLDHYFAQEKLGGGERFYMQFDDTETATQFYDTLRQLTNASAFTYRHHHGATYETFALRYEQYEVIVAATIRDVTPDFLVTLRNQVGEQEGVFAKKAMLFICSETLDSIRGGSSDLQKEGMPFNIRAITASLDEEIAKNEQLSRADKAVIRHYLQQKLEDMVLQPSIWDYDEILALLQKGTVEKEDYRELGMFYDSELSADTSLTDKQIRERIADNRQLFDKVQSSHEYGNAEMELKKHVDEKMVNTLKNDDWHELSFAKVKTAFEQAKGRAITYREVETKKHNKAITYWDRPSAETKTGQRKRYFIIFNDELKETEFTLEFDTQLKKDSVAGNDKALATVSGKKIVVRFPSRDGVQFYSVKYKDESGAKSSFDLRFCIVPFPEAYLDGMQPFYEIAYSKKDPHMVLNYTDDHLAIGYGEDVSVHMTTEDMALAVRRGQRLLVHIEPSLMDENELRLQLSIDGHAFPLKLKYESHILPLATTRVWKLKREKQEHFRWLDGKLHHGTALYYAHEDLRKRLELEQQWIDEQMSAAKMELGQMRSYDMALPETVRNAYNDYIAYFSKSDLLPSLAYVTPELAKLIETYATAVQRAIGTIEANAIMTEEQKQLFKLGTLQEGQRLWFTPFHPLVAQYQVALAEVVGDEEVDSHLLARLRPDALLPFVYGPNDQLYRPVPSSVPEWYSYESAREVTVGHANLFLANIVEEKLEQFIHHFDYLFMANKKSPILVNVMQIHNDEELLRGVLQFMKKRLEKHGVAGVIPVHLVLYRNTTVPSAFEQFSLMETAESLGKEFEKLFQSKVYDSSDVLRHLRENIQYYKLPFDPYRPFEYAHISFLKMQTEDRDAATKMDQIDSGVALNGLLSSVVAVSTSLDYRSGFGTKYKGTVNEQLHGLATALNELATNLKNDGSNSYNKEQSIVVRTTTTSTETLQKIYETSSWVTFIDPGFDLEFFQHTNRPLMIIHYNDQQTSERYDAITVTDKTGPYRQIIRDYLKQHAVEAEDAQIDATIKSFNTVNGEWLLRIIGSKGQFAREKISLVAAMKYAQAYLMNDAITWIPISLEEVLRVAGAVKLTQADGLFSAKRLGSKGAHSDDLLMIGLEQHGEQLYVHFYPIEVKIGAVRTAKATIQVEKTIELLREHLDETKTGKPFVAKFYRYFFAQLLLANAKKMKTNNLWTDEQYDAVYRQRGQLLNDEFTIATHLDSYIGQGAIVQFSNDAYCRSVTLEGDILHLNFIEQDAYRGVIEPLADIVTKMRTDEFDIPSNRLIVNNYQQSDTPRMEPTPPSYTYELDDDMSFDDEPFTVAPEVEEAFAYIAPQVAEAAATYTTASATQTVTEVVIEQARDEHVRVPVGYVKGSVKPIHWEFDHKDLANRHLFISGRSGQGKTYFVQCMLLELAKRGVSSLVIDYTDGYKTSQLEDEFKQQLGDKLQSFIVVRDKFPINPFRRNRKQIDDDIWMDEDDTEIAERIRNVFRAIYPSLGIQQLAAIYRAALNGIRQYGNQMNLQRLGEELEQDTQGNNASTALAQIGILIERNPFDDQAEFDWSFLTKGEGKVYIVQLTNYSIEMQKMITEFVLWDLWAYKLQHGTKDNPFPVVLDEAQRLDFSSGSPISRILTEGRKFGWSAWLATQFLKSGFTADAVSRIQMAAQKIYFAPVENEVSNIASNMTNDNAQRKDWEVKLMSLRKGECIFHGPTMKADGTMTPTLAEIVEIYGLGMR